MRSVVLFALSVPVLTQVTESAQQLEVLIEFAKHNGRVPREGGSAAVDNGKRAAAGSSE